MSKLDICVIFGGVSTEHEISLLSARNVIGSLDRERYRVWMVGITREGRWLLYEGDPAALPDDGWLDGPVCKAVLSPDACDHGLWIFRGGAPELLHIDAALIYLHGKCGEDGTVQGLLELAGIPYTGAGVLGNALCMDKAVAKQVFAQHGIPQARWIEADRASLKDPAALEARVAEELGFPVFVKASCSGSSIGAYKVKEAGALCRYVQEALQYDDAVLIEEFVDAREIESAVLGNDEPQVAAVGEVVAAAEFYDFDAKYRNPESQTVIPAPIDADTARRIQDYAVRAYKAARCYGFARVDFFVERKTGRVLLNELNTIPGFTNISMFPMLWAYEGLDNTRLQDRLIALAMEKNKG